LNVTWHSIYNKMAQNSAPKKIKILHYLECLGH
jgi:predicted DNA-binding transcriptional regulator AlpA